MTYRKNMEFYEANYTCTKNKKKIPSIKIVKQVFDSKQNQQLQNGW